MHSPLAYAGLLALAVALSFLVGLALVRSAHRHAHLTGDPTDGVQKVHRKPVPRVGGIAIFLALAGTWLLLRRGAPEDRMLAMLLVAGLPAFVAGLAEDVTKRVGVPTRLVATLASGLAATWLTGQALTRTGIPQVDELLAFWPIAWLFTAFAIGGVANAINIIDGFHGLAAGTLLISLAGLGVIAQQAGDPALAAVACLLGAAVLGFGLLNFPWGRLFLGDGGAYWCGFALAALAVQLLARNPSVSPWAAVLVCGYPTLEVLYSVVRRRRMRLSPGMADRSHLHSLVGRAVVMPRCAHLPPDLRNSAVAAVMWLFALVPVLAAVAFFEQPRALLAALLGCGLAYHLVYRRVAARAGEPAASLVATQRR